MNKLIARKSDVKWFNGLNEAHQTIVNDMGTDELTQLLGTPNTERNMEVSAISSNAIAKVQADAMADIANEADNILALALSAAADKLSVKVSDFDDIQMAMIESATKQDIVPDYELIGKMFSKAMQKRMFFNVHGKIDYQTKKEALQDDKDSELAWRVDQDKINKRYHAGDINHEEYFLETVDHFEVYPIDGKPSITVPDITHATDDGNFSIKTITKVIDNRVLKAVVKPKKSKKVTILKRRKTGVKIVK